MRHLNQVRSERSLRAESLAHGVVEVVHLLVTLVAFAAAMALPAIVGGLPQ